MTFGWTSICSTPIFMSSSLDWAPCRVRVAATTGPLTHLQLEAAPASRRVAGEQRLTAAVVSQNDLKTIDVPKSLYEHSYFVGFPLGCNFSPLHTLLF